MKLYVICRVADGTNDFPRPLNMTKKQVIGACFTSLAKSLDVAGDNCEIIVCDEGISDETRTFFQETCLKYNLVFRIEPRSTLHPNSRLAVADTLPVADPDTWVYFCNDDDLHDYVNFLPRLIDFISFAKNKSLVRPTFYHPADLPISYSASVYKGFVHQTLTGYIREVSHASSTFACHLMTYKNFADRLKACNNEDNRITALFKKDALCMSPLPGTVAPAREGSMSRLVDWDSFIYCSA